MSSIDKPAQAIYPPTQSAPVVPPPVVGGKQGLDISDEASRTYLFPGNQTVTILIPRWLWVMQKEKGDSHRIITADGKGVYIPAGWLAIEWMPKPGARVI